MLILITAAAPAVKALACTLPSVKGITQEATARQLDAELILSINQLVRTASVGTFLLLSE
jgi:hypothetical protein